VPSQQQRLLRASTSARKSLIDLPSDRMRQRFMDSNLELEIKSRFAHVQEDSSKGMVDESLELWKLRAIAQELSVSADDLVHWKRVFDSCDHNGDNSLDGDEFEELITKLLTAQLNDPILAAERARWTTENCCWRMDDDQNDNIGFLEFVRWYHSNGFKQDLLLSENERVIRCLAKQTGLELTFVDELKRTFDACVSGDGGQVDINEFERVLRKMLKMRSDIEMPRFRIAHFWSQIQHRDSGMISFQDFLIWWVMYFDEVGSLGACPFKDFYKQVRRVGNTAGHYTEHLDPPAYPSETQSSP